MSLETSVVSPVLTTSGMIIGVKTMERVASHKRRKKGSKRKTVKVRSYKRHKKKGKKK